MSEYEQIHQRYNFSLPAKYREMRDVGFFDFDKPNDFFLTDLEWLSLNEIATFEFLEFQIGGLIPFAKSARADLFCWYPKLAVNDKTPIIFCPRDDEEAFGYAEDFASFIYRILLEEFSGSWLVDEFGIEETSARFRKYAKNTKNYLPKQSTDVLCVLAKRPLKELEVGLYSVFTRNECNVLIESDLTFSHLNKVLKQYE